MNAVMQIRRMEYIKMSYRSEVVLAIKSQHYQKLLAQNFGLDDADTHVTMDEGHLFYWSWVKWYDEPMEMFLNDEIEYDDFLLIRLGEKFGDKEDLGGWWDNPFDLGVCQYLEFTGKNDIPDEFISKEQLKVLNSKPEASRCAKCHGALKEPMPGIKFCPVCE